MKKVCKGSSNIVDMVNNKEVNFVVNTTQRHRSIADSSLIRATTIAQNIPYVTTIYCGRRNFIGYRILGLQYSQI